MESTLIRRNGKIICLQKNTDDIGQIKYAGKFTKEEDGNEVFVDIITDLRTKRYLITIPAEQIILNDGTIVGDYGKCMDDGLRVIAGVSYSDKLEVISIYVDGKTGEGEFEYIGSE
jgi:hypothetical protein